MSSETAKELRALCRKKKRALINRDRDRTEQARREHRACFWAWPIGHMWRSSIYSPGWYQCDVCSKRKRVP